MKPTVEIPPGIVEPQHLYTKDELLRRLRWDDGSLRRARRAGLRCRYHGRQLFFIGRDVIEYIDQHGKNER